MYKLLIAFLISIASIGAFAYEDTETPYRHSPIVVTDCNYPIIFLFIEDNKPALITIEDIRNDQELIPILADILGEGEVPMIEADKLSGRECPKQASF